jgi:hypothetical protein
MSIDRQHPGRAAPLIPGAYERNTLTVRQPGSMGAHAVPMPVGSSSMDAVTIAAREREGGGAPSQRPRKVQVQTRNGPALRVHNGSWLTGGYLWFQILRLARR